MEKQQTPFFFDLTEPVTERTIYNTRLEHANHYTTDKAGIEHAYRIKMEQTDKVEIYFRFDWFLIENISHVNGITIYGWKTKV